MPIPTSKEPSHRHKLTEVMAILNKSKLVLYQSDNPQPILPQYRPMQVAVVCLYREQELYWDSPLVSTEDGFKYISIPTQHRSNTIIETYLYIRPFGTYWLYISTLHANLPQYK